MNRYDVVIVGAGQAGAQTAVALRLNGFAGSIAIVGEEPWAPYDRPPLSKEYLLGDKTFEQLLFRSTDSWTELGVDILTGRRIVTVDAAAQTVADADGEQLGYAKLVWATGGAARKLGCSGADARGIHTIRNRSDVDRLLGELQNTDHIVVIGGGYIGLEAAAALHKLGKRVVLVEALDRVLARVCAEPLSRFYEEEHRSRGVDIRLNTIVDRIETEEGRVIGVRLADSTLIPAGIVIVGIGIVPEIEPLVESGAASGNGLRVDELCRTSLPNIFAAGDCAEHSNAFAADDWVRVESVQNANDQASTVAKVICGQSEPYHAVPWFWSNQYDLKLQTVGLSRGHDEVILRGDPATRSFSLVYLHDGRVIALDCVNMVRDYSHGRALVAAGTRVSPQQLADPSLPLKALLQAK